MLVSLNFIEKFISLPKIEKEILVNGKKLITKIFDVQKIAPILTKQGFEVDSIEYRGENLTQIVVGKIESAKPHPNANKLQVCQINVGESNLRQIVCGAPNARAGLFVAVALPGAKLPNNLEIKPTSIREVESFGMLCSREELGLPINPEIDGDGIWELDVQAQGGKDRKELDLLIGTPVTMALNLDDVLLDISVTPNRPDMLSHEGVSRELATGFIYNNIAFERKNPYFSGKNIDIPEERIKEDAVKNNHIVVENIHFHAENYLDAPTFFMVLDSIKVTHSPAWLRNLLESLGQTSVNNVVDASNYILLAYGQPNHAFDMEKIKTEDGKNKKIILRHAHANENFIGLDGKSRQLHEADCVVSDSENVLALLGVLGGENSKVTTSTNKIVVEFANPNPVAIRRTSRRHGRQTEASFLFEKGIDAAARFRASSEFVSLLSELNCKNLGYVGTIHSKNLESHPILKTEFNHHRISFSKSDQKRVLGTEIISFAAQKNILQSLGFCIEDVQEDNILVTIPQWRVHDIANAADLVEEFIRVVGIDSIPAQPIVSANEVRKDDKHLAFIERVSAQTANLGYHEVISLHFMRADDYEKSHLNSINALGEPLALLNPIIGDEPLLHTTLIPDLLRKVSKNLSYGVKNGQLFHSCRTFQNYSLNGERVFSHNGESLNLKEKLANEIQHNLQEYSHKYGYSYCKEETKISRPVETPRLAGVLFGVKEEKNWQNSAPVEWSLHDVLSHVMELARIAGVKVAFEKITDEEHPMANALHPGRRVKFFIELENQEKLPIGWCGQFHPKVTRNYEIDCACFGFEINLATLLKASQEKNNFEKRSIASQKFPTVQRDFAFLVDEKLTAQEVKDTVKKSLQEITTDKVPVTLTDVTIFDIYRGKGIAKDKKSIAFKVILEPTLRTLNDKDIQSLTDKVVDSMTTQLGAQLRG